MENKNNSRNCILENINHKILLIKEIYAYSSNDPRRFFKLTNTFPLFNEKIMKIISSVEKNNLLDTVTINYICKLIISKIINKIENDVQFFGKIEKIFNSCKSLKEGFNLLKNALIILINENNNNNDIKRDIFIGEKLFENFSNILLEQIIIKSYLFKFYFYQNENDEKINNNKIYLTNLMNSHATSPEPIFANYFCFENCDDMYYAKTICYRLYIERYITYNYYFLDILDKIILIQNSKNKYKFIMEINTCSLIISFIAKLLSINGIKFYLISKIDNINNIIPNLKLKLTNVEKNINY